MYWERPLDGGEINKLHKVRKYWLQNIFYFWLIMKQEIDFVFSENFIHQEWPRLRQENFPN